MKEFTALLNAGRKYDIFFNVATDVIVARALNLRHLADNNAIFERLNL